MHDFEISRQKAADVRRRCLCFRECCVVRICSFAALLPDGKGMQADEAAYQGGRIMQRLCCELRGVCTCKIRPHDSVSSSSSSLKQISGMSSERPRRGLYNPGMACCTHFQGLVVLALSASAMHYPHQRLCQVSARVQDDTPRGI